MEGRGERRDAGGRARRAALWTLVGFLAGGAAGYLFPGPGPVRSPGPEGTGRRDEPPARSASSSDRPVIGGGTEVWIRTFYLGCGIEEVEEGPPSPAWVGLDRALLQARFPELEVLHFASDRVEVRRHEAGCPPEVDQVRTIGVDSGFVAIFQGPPEARGPLLRRTQIPVDRLMAQDRQRLERGIRAADEQEVAGFLEGLSEGFTEGAPVE